LEQCLRCIDAFSCLLYQELDFVRERPLKKLQRDYSRAQRGSHIEQIDRWYPSSKTCSICLAELEEMPLRVREWQCPACGTVHDRGVNAAQNIASVGLAQINEVGQEPPERTTPVEWVWPTLKPEAQAP
jgi:hypothetical protein